MTGNVEEELQHCSPSISPKKGIEVKKILILTVLLIAFVTSAVGVEVRGMAVSNNFMGFAFYPYWSEWGYWAYQYPNAYQPYVILNDTRKNVLQGKILNDGKPVKGKKILVGKVF